MTRTDLMASSRPPAAGSDKSWLRNRRGLLAIPIALLLAAVLMTPTVAFAAEGLSGYGKEEPKKEEPKKEEPKKEEPKKEEPKSGTSPSKEEAPSKETTPSKESEPATTSTTPSKAAAQSLPFTGFDLRLLVGAGVLMIGAGFSIVVVQRRAHRHDRR